MTRHFLNLRGVIGLSVTILLWIAVAKAAVYFKKQFQYGSGLLAAEVNLCPSSHWGTFRFAADATVLMPCRPARQTRQVDAFGTRAVLSTFAAKVRDKGVYSLAKLDLDQSEILRSELKNVGQRERELDKLVDAMAHAFAPGLTVEVTEKETRTERGEQYRDYRLSSDQGSFHRIRVTVAGNVLYALEVAGTREEINRIDRTFLASLDASTSPASDSAPTPVSKGLKKHHTLEELLKKRKERQADAQAGGRDEERIKRAEQARQRVLNNAKHTDWYK